MQTILYIEDNEDNIYMLTQRLIRRNFNVDVARDGESGLQLARDNQPALIIMDLVLPGIDGWETTRQMKNDPVIANIPIIALSASAVLGARKKAYDAGCDDFDIKPVDFSRLMKKIEALLQ